MAWGCGVVRRRQREQTFATATGQLPGHRAAPVVTNQMEAVVTERGRQSEHVADERVTGIGLGGGRSCAWRIAPLIGCGHAIARIGQRTDLVAPRPRRLREAMQQEDQLAVVGTGEAYVERQLAPVGVDNPDSRGIGRGHDEGAVLRRRKNFSRFGS